MKYKAIKVDDYRLIVSEPPIKEKDWLIDIIAKDIYQAKVDSETVIKGVYKLIAPSKNIGELPLFDVPDEWENNDYDLKQDLIILCEAWMKAKFPHYVDASYLLIKEVIMPQVNKAKEKYQFTLEDMQDAYAQGKKDFSRSNRIIKALERMESEFLQSLTKPKQYEVSLEMINEMGYCSNSKCYNGEGCQRPDVCKKVIGNWIPKITEGKVKILTWKEA